MTIRVLVAEDHPMFRDALQALLTGLPEFEVVAVTTTTEGLITKTQETAPDVAVVDLGLADGNAVIALHRLRDTVPACRVLVLTSADDDAAVYAALRAGARDTC